MDTARYLIQHGVPVFVAKRSNNWPKGGHIAGYWIPRGWQKTKADLSTLEAYEPGDALCAVMGHTVDAIDLDPRNGGDMPASLMPKSYGRAATPSGGTHDLVASMGVRSKDGLFPGVDLKAGVNGQGTGFIFISPTVKKNGGYEWISPPNFEGIEDDTSNSDLKEYLQNRSHQTEPSRYSGPSFSELSPDLQDTAKEWMNSEIARWESLMVEAKDWPEGHRDAEGRGWELLARDFAWFMATTAVATWSPLDIESARSEYHRVLPPEITSDPVCSGKWYEGLIEKAGAGTVRLPPWSDFEKVSAEVAADVGLPPGYEDFLVAKWLKTQGFNKKYAWTPTRHWLNYNGTHWDEIPEEALIFAIGEVVEQIHAKASLVGKKDAAEAARLLQHNRCTAIARALRGILRVKDSLFDNYPDLLNCANGILDLKTGRLINHDPGYFFTKCTGVNYDPNARSNLLDQVLQAIDPEVLPWLQIKMGQMITGYTPADDTLLIGQGSGANGKTTFMTAVLRAIGPYGRTLSDRVLFAPKSAHPTEKTDLLGLRLGLLEETQEGGRLDTQQLKQAIGTTEMTARRIGRDSITWKASHAIVILTNFAPSITEMDDGTWRRLLMVKFDQPIKKDPDLLRKVNDGYINEAMLTWLAQGAKRWYDDKRLIFDRPERVNLEKQEWRTDSDTMEGFFEENLIYSPGSCILSVDLVTAMNGYLESLYMRPWSYRLAYDRLVQYTQSLGYSGVVRKRTRDRDSIDSRYGVPISKQNSVIANLRWASPDDLDQNRSDFDLEDLI